MWLEDGSPASPVGELIDVIVKEGETANQSDSQGTANADVPAEEGQAMFLGLLRATPIKHDLIQAMLFAQRLQHFGRRHRQFIEPFARGVGNRIGNRR